MSSDSTSLSSFLGEKSVSSGILTRDGDLAELGLVDGSLLTVSGDVTSSFLTGRFEYRVTTGGDMYIRVIFGETLRSAASAEEPVYLSFCGGMLYLDGRVVKGLLPGEESLRPAVLRGVSSLPSEYPLPVEKRRDFVGVRVRLFDLFGDTVECSLDLIFPVLFLSFLVDSFFSRATFLSWYNELWKFPPILTGFGPYTD